MIDEKLMLGPIVYAALKGMKAYKEAEGVYKEFPTDNKNDDMILKLLSSLTGEIQKYSDSSPQDFLKEYQKFESMFSLALKLLG